MAVARATPAAMGVPLTPQRVDADRSTRPIREVMTPDPEALSPDDPIVFALNKMSVGGFRHVPLVDPEVPHESYVADVVEREPPVDELVSNVAVVRAAWDLRN